MVVWTARAAVAVTVLAGVAAFALVWAPPGDVQKSMADGFMKVFSHGAFGIVAFGLGRASAKPKAKRRG